MKRWMYRERVGKLLFQTSFSSLHAYTEDCVRRCAEGVRFRRPGWVESCSSVGLVLPSFKAEAGSMLLVVSTNFSLSFSITKRWIHIVWWVRHEWFEHVMEDRTLYSSRSSSTSPIRRFLEETNMNLCVPVGPYTVIVSILLLRRLYLWRWFVFCE